MGSGKLSRNYEGVDRFDTGRIYTGELPKPGVWYEAKLVSAEDHPTKANPDNVQWLFLITEPPYEGCPIYKHTNGTTTASNEIQILEAIGVLGKGKNSIDMTFPSILKKAKPVLLSVTHEEYQGVTRAKFRTVLPGRGGSSVSSPSSDEDEVFSSDAGDDEEPF